MHIHSKVIVLDPFGANPVVMTGSHNLGFKASHSNDHNLMIVQGNAPLAAAYAANIIAIYQAYRWNAYVEAHRQDPQVWHGLVDSDTWQDGYLKDGDDNLKEILFWLGDHSGAAAATPALAPGPAPSGGDARSVTAGPGPKRPAKPKTKKTTKKKKTKKKTAKKKSAKKKTVKKASSKKAKKKTAKKKKRAR